MVRVISEKLFSPPRSRHSSGETVDKELAGAIEALSGFDSKRFELSDYESSSDSHWDSELDVDGDSQEAFKFGQSDGSVGGELKRMLTALGGDEMCSRSHVLMIRVFSRGLCAAGRGQSRLRGLTSDALWMPSIDYEPQTLEKPVSPQAGHGQVHNKRRREIRVYVSRPSPSPKTSAGYTRLLLPGPALDQLGGGSCLPPEQFVFTDFNPPSALKIGAGKLHQAFDLDDAMRAARAGIAQRKRRGNKRQPIRQQNFAVSQSRRRKERRRERNKLSAQAYRMRRREQSVKTQK
ncbi:hypothetical protein BaRGS_00006089, partial [Batillaria attramentaria]